MATRSLIADFLSQKKLAIVGMSREKNKFGNAVYKDLTAKGYEMFPVHPEAEAIEGARCWKDLQSLPERVGGVVIVVPPSETEKVVEEARAAGITRVWMQQGAESPAAVRYCEENGMAVVHRQCVMMHAEPIRSVHLVHRWLAGLFGKLPK
jgi:predicted CoA-binding protein